MWLVVSVLSFSDYSQSGKQTRVIQGRIHLLHNAPSKRLMCSFIQVNGVGGARGSVVLGLIHRPIFNLQASCHNLFPIWHDASVSQGLPRTIICRSREIRTGINPCICLICRGIMVRSQFCPLITIPDLSEVQCSWNWISFSLQPPNSQAYIVIQCALPCR